MIDIAVRRLYIRKLVVSSIISLIALTVLGITFQTDQEEASHTYQVAGTYNSVITVLDDDGGESSGLLTFVVSQPEATISIPSLSGWGIAVFIIIVGSVSVIRRYKAVRS